MHGEHPSVIGLARDRALGRPSRRRSFIVPQNKDLKRLVRARMAETGENYTQALAHLQGEMGLEPLPPAWHMTGNRAPDYEAGLLPGAEYMGDRVARLRLRPEVAEPSGFGALVQTIATPRYLGHRVRFSAMLKATEVTGWAGLWMRVDGLSGNVLEFDNMEERALRGTTDWTEAAIVLDVPEQARKLLFGVLLSRAGAIDLARLRFEEADQAVPTAMTAVSALPEEPQALDFSAAQ
jgi:hypothetical protein